MSRLRAIIEHLPWTRLVPAPELLAEQPGRKNPGAFIAAARAGTECVVVYVPLGGTVRFAPGAMPMSALRRLDPATGAAEPLEWREGHAVELPAGRDWLIVGGVRFDPK
jgi:hypothetical protein